MIAFLVLGLLLFACETHSSCISTQVKRFSEKPKMVFDQERVVEAVPLNLGRNNGGNVEFRYRECTKNHALSINGYAIDGCGEFMPAGEEGTLEGILCAACNCHRNFHRSEAIVPNQVLYYHYYRPAGYQHQEVTLAQAVQPQTLSAASDPSSSGGSIRKRHRTRFTQGQKDQMLEFAKALGWRIQKGKEETVEQFCAQLGIRKQVLKVWMHNNKHTLGKQP